MENIEKLQNDPLIKLLKEKGCKNFTLVGGAVVDILEGRKPKDYDFIKISDSDLKDELNAEFLYETKTAKTYKAENFIIQVLKTIKEDFDFLISQSTYDVDYRGKENIVVNSISFDKKILIPSQIAWTEKKNALNSLKRIVHWKKKGYTIADETYLSLLNVIGNFNSNNS